MVNKIVFVLVVGILLLLGFIVIGDFIISYEDNRPINESIIQLLQITITGLIGIIGTYFGSKSNQNNDT